MFRYVAKNPVQFLTTDNRLNPRTTHLLLLLSSLHNSISKTLIQEPNHNDSSSFTVSYLINSCGLSPQSALSAAQKLTIKTTKKPDSNLFLFSSQGFTDTQIAKLITRNPRLLLSNWDKSIKPKFDYLASVGYSGAALTSLIASNPRILEMSVHKKLKPNFDLVSSILGTEKQMADAIRRSSYWLLTIKLQTNFLPNVRTLQCYGVPASNIAKLATKYPRALMQATAQFKMNVGLVRNMRAIDPLSSKFLEGIRVMVGMNPSTWERKVTFFKSLGWSEAEIISAFTKEPPFIINSDKKIRRAMDFFEEVMHWGPSFVAAHPVILGLSFEKRIVPRCSVLRVLASKGLVTKNSSAQFLIINEINFLNKYVTKHQDQVPDVLCAYKGNLDSL